MMTQITANNGTQWTIFNIQTTPTDSLYKILQHEIDGGNPTQENLQKLTGYRAPIVINRGNHTIHFERW